MADRVTPQSTRKLDQDLPELKQYLRPGMNVLDVGCGSGTITVDVAAVVKPGRVTGLNPDERDVRIAREWLEQQPGTDNVSFAVGDSHKLDFPDSVFDLVYSHTVCHFFLDPIAALREQARVTKPGGWVVASGVRHWVTSVRYPACPSWDRLMDARRKHWEQRIEAFRASGLRPGDFLKQELAKNPTYGFLGDVQAGSKCTGWYVDAGITDIHVSVKAEHLFHYGCQSIEPSVWDLLPLEQPNTPLEQQISLDTQAQIADGLLDPETLERARTEIEAWYKDPHAFFHNLLTLVAGKVDKAG